MHDELHEAARCGDLKLMKKLLDGWADVEWRSDDVYEMTPLHIASKHGKVEAMTLLIDRGANIEAMNRFDKTPLYAASAHGRVEAMTLLVDRGANINATDNFSGETPLRAALAHGNIEAITLLVDRGANIDARNKDGNTPLHAAAEIGKVEGMALLIDRGANIDAVGKYGHTPLRVASGSGKVEAMTLLVDRGANIDATDKYYGKTPLHAASEIGNIEAMALLVDRGANIDAVGKDGKTPLRVALAHGNIEAMTLLVDRGANIDAVGKYGHTPLRAALAHGNIEGMALLLDRGANIDAADNDGKTPLHAASWSGKVEVVTLLLDRGANIDAVDKDGKTPLDAATGRGRVSRGRDAAARLLRSRGAAKGNKVAATKAPQPVEKTPATRERKAVRAVPEPAKTSTDEGPKPVKKPAARAAAPKPKPRPAARPAQAVKQRSPPKPPAPAAARPLPEWSPNEVAAWLPSLGAAYARYGDAFLHHGIDGALLAELTDADLRDDVGVSSALHRRKLLRAVTLLASASAGAESRELVHIPRHELRLGRELGRGYYGVARLAVYHGTEVVLKELRAEHATPEAGAALLREAELLAAAARHPHVVSVIGLVPPATAGGAPAMVVEYVRGGSADAAAEPPLSVPERLRVAADVAGALAHLHGLGLVHRDLAARNVLLTRDRRGRLADFGMARGLGAGGASASTVAAVGPVAWMAPESLRARRYSKASDAYMFGSMLWELLAGRAPHAELALPAGELAARVTRDGLRPAALDEAQCPAAVAALLARCFEERPEARPSAVELRNALEAEAERADTHTYGSYVPVA